MHRINDAIVRDGKLVLSDLPFSEGQHVRILVEENPQAPLSIQQVRAMLKGAVIQFDNPFEAMLPVDSWEILK